MDARLLPFLACPACRTHLAFDGERQKDRILNGTLHCGRCGRGFLVRDEVAVLVLEGTPLDGAVWSEEWATGKREVYEHAADRLEKMFGTDAIWQEMVSAAVQCRGLVVDIATGPGGSRCVPCLRQAGTRRCRVGDDLFVVSDLGEPVVRGLRAYLKEVGLAPQASFLVFDARRMPFRDRVVSGVTSVMGFSNVLPNLPAYQEAHRVLKLGGCLIGAERVYAPTRVPRPRSVIGAAVAHSQRVAGRPATHRFHRQQNDRMDLGQWKDRAGGWPASRRRRMGDPGHLRTEAGRIPGSPSWKTGCARSASVS